MRPMWLGLTILFFAGSGHATSCSEGDARIAAQSYYQAVRTDLYIPEGTHLVEIRPHFSESTYELLAKARKAEDAWVKAMTESGEDWWLDGTAIFFSWVDGYDTSVIDGVDMQNMQVHATLRGSVNGQSYFFKERLVPVSENGRCVIHDVLFERGGSMRVTIARMIGEYERESERVSHKAAK